MDLEHEEQNSFITIAQSKLGEKNHKDLSSADRYYKHITSQLGSGFRFTQP